MLLSVFVLVSCANGTRPGGSGSDPETDFSIRIPPGGNSWVVNDPGANEDVISDSGIHNWTDTGQVIRTWFKVTAPGKVYVGLNARVPEGTSVLRVTLEGDTREIVLDHTDYKDVYAGKFEVETPGYYYVELQGKERSSGYIADINEILIGGSATEETVYYVKDDFYWGRRGPSVHLNYEVPAAKDILWFYNEVTVPEGEDIVGSYFMANGFGQGYFGIQVNSESERRVLFSVWSPYETDDPSGIPDDYKIILLDKGDDVHAGEFGNEGSGGQSYRKFMWKAETTYRFLLKGEPSENNSTDFTAWFFAPETGEWELMASFRRPHTSTYLTRPHSFLENFRTETGFKSRKGLYSNQWVRDVSGEWHELTRAKFTADATARKEARMDYAGGTEGSGFFMRNCGFFSKNTEIDSYHTRQDTGVPPSVDLSALE
ncbi:nematoblast specific protein [Sinomicrobium soli]|nr:nematoblast specific protein [Sinomicrobium sp. N-1-3-6]